MRFGKVNFPEPLLNAQKNGTLVVFAGAGVSMGPPANYPNFTQLADKVASGVMERDKDEPIDRFLGRLKGQGVQVHRRTCDILSNHSSKPNQLHHELLKLFPSASKVRLVTTNFDTHFTTAASSLLNDEFEVFHAPAFPLGHDFTGIVYLHGCVEKGPKRLVLTDGDFGRAYLTQGWARRFLLEMFSEYTVLFVGYSYNDPVVPYLTRGLPPNRPGLRFALVNSEDDPERWEFLGITPITYPLQDEPNSHSALGEAIVTWVTLTQLGTLDRERRIREIVELPPPLDPEDADYIENALTDPVTTRFFTRHAKTPDWLRWAEGKGLFQPLFQPSEQVSEISRQIGSWFTWSFVCEHPDEAFALVMRQGQRLNPVLWCAIADRLVAQQSGLDAETFAKWVTVLLCSPQPHEQSELLEYLLDNCRHPEDDLTALLLFEHLTKPRLDLRQGFGISKEDGQKIEPVVDEEVSVAGDEYLLHESWQKLFRPNLAAFAQRLEPILTCHLQQAHFLLRAVGKADELWDSLSHGRSAIEPHEQDEYLNEMDTLINAARDVLQWMLENRLDRAHSVIQTWSNSGIPLLKRLAIHGVAKSTRFTPDEKITWLLERDWLYTYGLKHEVFFLLQSAYPNASESSRSRLLEQVCRGDQAEAFQNLSQEIRQYEIYNLLAWLHQAAPNCPLVTQRFTAIQQENPNFKSREYLDLDHRIASFEEGSESPITANELLTQNPQEKIDWLLTYQEEGFWGSRRGKLLSAVTEAVARSYKWSWQLVIALQSKEEWNSDLWRSILYGWCQGTLTEEQWENSLTFLNTNHQLYAFAGNIADLLEQGVTKQQSEIPSSCLSLAEELAEQLWERCTHDSENRIIETESWLTKAINHPGGKLVEFWLHTLSRRRSEAGESWVCIPPQFKSYFHKVITGVSYAGELGRVVLASRLLFLFDLDADWARENVLPLLDWSTNLRQAQQGWHGFLARGRWNENLLPYLIPLYEQTFVHLLTDLACSRLCERFINDIANIAVYSSRNLLQEGWIGKFLKAVNFEERKRWAFHIGRILRSMEEEVAQKLWNRWLKDYWEQRITGIPLPLEPDELEYMIEWSFYLKSVFPEVVEKICTSPIQGLKYTRLSKKILEKNYANSHPEALTRLLLHLLSHTHQPFWFSDVEELVKSLIHSSASRYELKQICNHLGRLGCPNAAKLEELLNE